MKKINQNQIEWIELKSPKRKFQIFRRHISLALEGKKDVGTWGGGHPFDVELTRVPPGKTNWPYHAHSTQWEMYIILSGRGQLRTGDGQSDIMAGDCFIHPPGDAHQIINNGTEDLTYYIITDNPPSDIGSYPDSNKWFVKPLRKIFEMTEVDYFKGEE
jgi:uncharacterized cupin superfamily protein